MVALASVAPAEAVPSELLADVCAPASGEPAGGAAGKLSLVNVLPGLAALFFCSRARLAASATDGALSDCACAYAVPSNPVVNKNAAERATKENVWCSFNMAFT